MGCITSSPRDDIYGPIIGDVSKNSAVVWARSKGVSAEVKLTINAVGKKGEIIDVRMNSQEAAKSWLVPSEKCELPATFTFERGTSATKRLILSNLSENTEYVVEFGDRKAMFKTCGGKTLKIVWGSCVGGQRYGRRLGAGISGLPLISTMSQENPDAFVFLGDTYYADDPIPATCNLVKEEEWKNAEPEDYTCQTKEKIFTRHEYFLRDDTYSSFLRKTPVYVTWDDHEVINDWGGSQMQKDNPDLLRECSEAFFENWPITLEEQVDSPCGKKLYRHIEMGVCDLFMLDCRQYRSVQTKVDEDGPPQLTHILAKEQTDWLVHSLKKSKAIWKLIGCSVPISLKTGSNADEVGCDSYANNAATGELKQVFDTLIAENIQNVVFLSGDVHFPFAFKYELTNGPTVHEFGASPIHALPLPNTPAEDLGKDLPVDNREELYNKGKFGGTGFAFGMLVANEMKMKIEFRSTAETLFSYEILANNVAE